MRAGAVIHQLVHCRVKQYPYKLFQLLNRDNNIVELAETILQTPTCMQDSFTAHVLKKYNTSHKLAGEEAFVFLELVARKSMCTTYTTERLHSRNFRRAKSRTMTQKIDLNDLALPHLAHAGPHFSHEILHKQSKDKEQNNQKASKKYGRPCKRKAPECTDDGAGVAEPPTRKRGGGGAWRAFQQLQLQGQKFTGPIVKELSEKYKHLSDEEKLHYKEVGRAGWSTYANHDCKQYWGGTLLRKKLGMPYYNVLVGHVFACAVETQGTAAHRVGEKSFSSQHGAVSDMLLPLDSAIGQPCVEDEAQSARALAKQTQSDEQAQQQTRVAELQRITDFCREHSKENTCIPLDLSQSLQELGPWLSLPGNVCMRTFDVQQLCKHKEPQHDDADVALTTLARNWGQRHVGIRQPPVQRK
eukprot:4209867-Amphidinium_carterae.1